MNSNNFNLVSIEKFDEALNIVNDLSSCNVSGAMSTLGGSVPSSYSGISGGITDIKNMVSRLADGSGPEGLINNYMSGYASIKNAIIESYIAEYEFTLENGNIMSNASMLKNLSSVEKSKFVSEFSDLLKNMKNKSLETDIHSQYSGLTEFFKDIQNTLSKYSVSLELLANNISDLQPKNNRDIAHRGYTPGGILDNSAEGFRLAGQKGFWGCEADIRFDSNGNLVCSHNEVKKGQTVTTFEEYLDICKEYGMTAIIDLKYEKGVGPADPNLSPAVLKVIQQKGMMDSCVLQTNNPTDIPYIRQTSSNARIWYLTDVISDKNLKLIEDNNVECVNARNTKVSDNSIKKLVDNGVDVCVWNVESEYTKNRLLNVGAKYVMSDNVLGITPYESGDENLNDLRFNLDENIEPVLLGANNSKGLNTNTVTNTSNTLNTSTSGIRLTAPMGHINGPEAYETFYDEGMSKVVENMEKSYGYTNLKTSIRSDGVKVLSGTAPDGTTFKDLVMVAADVKHEIANPQGAYERGQIVDTSLGKGIVVDACELATTKRENNEGVHFDIATAWHTQPYESQAYSKENMAAYREYAINEANKKNNVTAQNVDVTYKTNASSSSTNLSSNVSAVSSVQNDTASSTNSSVSSNKTSGSNTSNITSTSSNTNASSNSTLGTRLTAPMGHIDGPEAYETFYDAGMSKVVENMEKLYGYTNLKSSIRSDGVKLLSGTAPDGTTFKDLVMVAADVKHEIANPQGTYERGQVVDTSLGKGIVVDASGIAINKRENNNGNHFDIATAWHSQPYESQVYSKENMAAYREYAINEANKKSNITNQNVGVTNESNASSSSTNLSSNVSAVSSVQNGTTSSSNLNSSGSSSNSSNTIVNSSSTNSESILPNNKFSDVLPQISNGNLGSVEVRNNSINYELYNVSDNTYSDYVKALIDKGYTMTDYGKFIKDNCEVVTNITKDGNMSIILKQI